MVRLTQHKIAMKSFFTATICLTIALLARMSDAQTCIQPTQYRLGYQLQYQVTYVQDACGLLIPCYTAVWVPVWLVDPQAQTTTPPETAHLSAQQRLIQSYEHILANESFAFELFPTDTFSPAALDPVVVRSEWNQVRAKIEDVTSRHLGERQEVDIAFVDISEAKDSSRLQVVINAPVDKTVRGSLSRTFGIPEHRIVALKVVQEHRQLYDASILRKEFRTERGLQEVQAVVETILNDSSTWRAMPTNLRNREQRDRFGFANRNSNDVNTLLFETHPVLLRIYTRRTWLWGTYEFRLKWKMRITLQLEGDSLSIRTCAILWDEGRGLGGGRERGSVGCADRSVHGITTVSTQSYIVSGHAYGIGQPVSDRSSSSLLMAADIISEILKRNLSQSGVDSPQDASVTGESLRLIAG